MPRTDTAEHRSRGRDCPGRSIPSRSAGGLETARTTRPRRGGLTSFQLVDRARAPGCGSCRSSCTGREGARCTARSVRCRPEGPGEISTRAVRESTPGSAILSGGSPGSRGGRERTHTPVRRGWAERGDRGRSLVRRVATTSERLGPRRHPGWDVGRARGEIQREGPRGGGLDVHAGGVLDARDHAAGTAPTGISSPYPVIARGNPERRTTAETARMSQGTGAGAGGTPRSQGSPRRETAERRRSSATSRRSRSSSPVPSSASHVGSARPFGETPIPPSSPFGVGRQRGRVAATSSSLRGSDRGRSSAGRWKGTRALRPPGGVGG